jgi:hypothetical protein
MAKHDAGYERLGAKVLSLPDVIAQSVGFMGPVFSSAFVIPLVVGVISASGQGGGVVSRACWSRSGCPVDDVYYLRAWR